MAIHPKTSRIVVWTIALTGLLALGFVAYGHFAVPPQPIEPISCESVPLNIVKLGPAVAVDNLNDLPEINAMGWPELRAKVRRGDTLHEFETQTTGGHLAMRGDCYLGQAVAWMR